LSPERLSTGPSLSVAEPFDDAKCEIVWPIIGLKS
jgi:hypothetical protein